MKIRLTAVLAVTALGILAASTALGVPQATAGAARASSAGTFIRTYLHLTMSRQYAKLWSQLHPAQQAFVSRDRFIDCENQRDEALGFALKLVKFKVIRTHQEKILIPGTQQTTQSTAVKFKYTARTGDVVPITDDSHAVRVNGVWKVDDFEAGLCVQGRSMPDLMDGAGVVRGELG